MRDWKNGSHTIHLRHTIQRDQISGIPPMELLREPFPEGLVKRGMKSCKKLVQLA